MSKRKYTDEEIVKALECCQSHTITDCRDCPNRASGDNCVNELMRNALDLINRQKAEIERLKAEQMMAEGYADALEERAKAEAIKEFAERLKANMCHGYPYLEIEEDLFRRDVDNLVAEMTEGE